MYLRINPNPASWRQGMVTLLRPDEAMTLVHEALEISWLHHLKRTESLSVAIRRYIYVPDPASMDIWRSPAATTADGGGDCEDLALLAGSALIGMGVAADVICGRLCANGV